MDHDNLVSQIWLILRQLPIGSIHISAILELWQYFGGNTLQLCAPTPALWILHTCTTIHKQHICAQPPDLSSIPRMPAVWIAPVGEIDYSTKLASDVELVYKYWLLMRGIVENVCPRGEIQPLPTIHRGL